MPENPDLSPSKFLLIVVLCILSALMLDWTWNTFAVPYLAGAVR